MNDFRENLKEFLLNNIPGKVVAGDKEYLTRCPFCGDSIHLKSAHFYINLPTDENTPVMYHCKKCNTSGVLNRSTLRSLGVEVVDSDILSDLIKRHKKLNGSFIRGSNKNKSIYKFRTINDYISINENTEYKLKYINDRLGLNLSYQDILHCKIVLNLYDLWKSNDGYVKGAWLHNTRDKRIMDELNESFIGFLGYNNGVLNMRNLKKEKDFTKYLNKRYVNYNLFPSDQLEGTSKYYIIPTVIDTLNPEPVKIHIAEGPFDVLSIFYNLYNGNKDNSIYASIEGKSYINIIKFLLADLRIINAEIHIYFDNDVSNKEIRGVLEQLQYLNIDVYFHWNRKIISQSVDGKNIIYEKDYGVSKDNILDYCEQVIKST